jgi:hypothetical protein
VSDSPATPVARLADYPVIDAGVGGFGASFQIIDAVTCTGLPVAAYTFEYTSDDPTIVEINPPQVIDGCPATKTVVGLHLLAPGTTTVHATARDCAGQLVGSTEMYVTVQPGEAQTAKAGTTAPPTAETATVVSGREISTDVSLLGPSWRRRLVSPSTASCGPAVRGAGGESCAVG